MSLKQTRRTNELCLAIKQLTVKRQSAMNSHIPNWMWIAISFTLQQLYLQHILDTRLAVSKTDRFDPRTQISSSA